MLEVECVLLVHLKLLVVSLSLAVKHLWGQPVQSPLNDIFVQQIWPNYGKCLTADVLLSKSVIFSVGMVSSLYHASVAQDRLVHSPDLSFTVRITSSFVIY